MGQTVFILGAGASAAVGAPVMAEFLDVAEDLLHAGLTGDDSKAFENVFKGIHALQAVYAKSYIDSKNLEAVFTAFEMAEILCTLPGYMEPGKCQKLIFDFKRVIVRTLELTTDIVAGTGLEAAVPYRRFADHVHSRIATTRDSCALITFNYDCALDYALAKAGLRVDYALTGPVDELFRVDLLKLHGSLNWAANSSGSDIRVLPPSEFDLLASLTRRSPIRSPVSSTTRKKLGLDPTYAPVIVPPTWAKSMHYHQLASVWRRAAQHLAEAENIIIAGYSLPPTDEFFRNLFALGSIGSARLRRVWVFDLYPTREMERRYRHMLGRLAESSFRVFVADFKDLVAQLGDKEFLGLDNAIKNAKIPDFRI